MPEKHTRLVGNAVEEFRTLYLFILVEVRLEDDWVTVTQCLHRGRIQVLMES